METLRYKFWDVFQELQDGSLTPKKQIDVNGIVFGPGVAFQRGVVFGGVDFQLYKQNDIAGIEMPGEVLKIVGFYK